MAESIMPTVIIPVLNNPMGLARCIEAIRQREAFERVGGFRTDLVASEDVDLSFRVRKAGFRVICDPKIINYHDGDPQTLIDFFARSGGEDPVVGRHGLHRGICFQSCPACFGLFGSCWGL